MAPPPSKAPGLGALGGIAAKMVFKTSLNILSGSKGIIDYLAAEAYRDETGLEFTKLSAGDKALWVNRVRSIIAAASNTVSF